MNHPIFILFIAVLIAFAMRKVDHGYNAKFGSALEFINPWNHGFSITGTRALTKHTSFENVAVFGPTGSGKTSVLIINSAESISRGDSSIVYFDISGELYEKTSGFLFSRGYRILKLDFGTGAYESFNPLARCKSIADIQKVAHLITINSMGQEASDPFWNRSSEMIISLFSRYLIFYQEPQYRNLYNVLRLVEQFIIQPESVDLLFVKTNDTDLIDSYKATVAMGEKTLQSVVASVRAALNLWTDESVIRATSNDTINFSQLREDKICLYVSVPLKDVHYYKPLTALFFQSLFNELMSVIPGKNSRAVFTILEEAATMKFSNLSTIISNIRKYRSGILLCMQDEQALISQYGQAEAHQIKTNCGTQVYLKGQPLHTCKELSQILGKYTYTDEKEIKRVRELMAPEEIRMSDDAIILINNRAPLKCKTVPYYAKTLSQLGKIQPHKLTENVAIDAPKIKIA